MRYPDVRRIVVPDYLLDGLFRGNRCECPGGTTWTAAIQNDVQAAASSVRYDELQHGLLVLNEMRPDEASLGVVLLY